MSVRPNSTPAEPPAPAASVKGTLIAIEICALGDLRRADIGQLRRRHEMYARLRKVCAMMQLLWPDCQYEDGGDGVLVVAPPGIRVGELLEPLARDLRAVLGPRDRRAGRLRVAVHAGLVHRDAHGFAGPDLAHLFGLLDSRTLRTALESVDADLGMIVSDRRLCDGEHLLDPAAYRRLPITRADAQAHAWVWLPR
jgi:hypothetical protein